MSFSNLLKLLVISLPTSFSSFYSIVDTFWDFWYNLFILESIYSTNICLQNYSKCYIHMVKILSKTSKSLNEKVF